MGSRANNNNNGRRSSQPSTAHMESGGRLSTALLNNENARFAYDTLVSTCADFLGSPIIDTIVTQFAENILTLIESPTTLDSPEVKRRIEQILPTSHEYKYHRGMSISDNDCSRLCSLADRVANNAPYTNLNIVDDNEIDSIRDQRRASSHSGYGNDVHYIRSNTNITDELLPKQLPSFIESNFDMDREVQYDLDVTPYDSDNDDEPIRMV